jgi:hypothetical protein
LILLSCTALAARAHDPEAQQPFGRLHAHKLMMGHVHAGWESRYASEGRDALDGDSLWTGSVELGWNHLAAGLWFGSSPDRDYDELQLSLALAQELGDVELYLGFTHLRFPSDGAHDNEVGAGFAWSGLLLDLEFTADVYYSFDAGGLFSEIALGREIPVTERLVLHASILFGMNHGYVADGHDGANHVALRLGAEFAVTESWSVTIHSAYNWALDRDAAAPGDDQLVDFLHGGLGLQWSF